MADIHRSSVMGPGPSSGRGRAVGRGCPPYGPGVLVLTCGSAGRLEGRPRTLRLVVRAELDQRQATGAVGAEVLGGREREGEGCLPERGRQLRDRLDRL